MENKPHSAGYAKTDAYVGENRKLGDRFCVKGLQEFAGANESSVTVQLQISIVVLAVVAHRKWNFRVMDVSRAFLRSRPLKRDTCVKLPDWVE